MRKLLLLAALGVAAGTVRAEPDPDVVKATGWLVDHAFDLSKRPAGMQADAMSSGRWLCAMALTGYLLECSDGPETSRARAYELLAPRVRAGSPAQQTWSDGLFALYLAERHLRGRGEDDGDLWRALVGRIEAGQNAEGGWGHGGLEIGFYPSTLIAATNSSVMALGLARQCGIRTDDDVLESALALYREMQAASGAWPYGGRHYRKGFEAGRTAGTVAALAAVGVDDAGAEMVKRAVAYLRRNADVVPKGHASPAMHVLSGAYAFHALGIFDEYSRAVLGRVADHQQEDGSFRDILRSSPDSLSFISGSLPNEMYVTAFYAAALAVPRSKVAEFLRGRVTASPAVSPREVGPVLTQRWSVDAEGAHVAMDDRHVLVASADGALRVYGAQDGTLLRELKADSDRPVAGMFAFAGHGYVFRGPEAQEQALPQSLGGLLGRGARKLTWSIAAYDLGSGERLWARERAGRLFDVTAGYDRVYALNAQDGVEALRLVDGETDGKWPAPKPVANGGVRVGSNGSVAATGEASLQVSGPDGGLLWQRTGRRKQRLTPAAMTTLEWSDTALLVGSSDGFLRARAPDTGKVVWRRALGASIWRLGVTAKHVLALTWDGRVHALDLATGEPAWRFEIPLETEHQEFPAMSVAGGRAFVHGNTSTDVFVLEAATGRVLGRLPSPGGPPVSYGAFGDRAVLSTAGAVRVYDLP